MDPAANPYLAIAAVLEAGLDGLKNKIEPEESVDRNIYRMDAEERSQSHITNLPDTLHNALKDLAADEVMKKAMGPHLYPSFIEAKNLEYDAYRTQVSKWERDQYMELY